MKILQTMVLGLLLMFATSSFAGKVGAMYKYTEASHSLAILIIHQDDAEVTEFRSVKYYVYLTAKNKVGSIVLDDKQITLKEAGFKVIDDESGRYLVVGPNDEAIKLK